VLRVVSSVSCLSPLSAPPPSHCAWSIHTCASVSRLIHRLTPIRKYLRAARAVSPFEKGGLRGISRRVLKSSLALLCQRREPVFETLAIAHRTLCLTGRFSSDQGNCWPTHAGAGRPGFPPRRFLTFDAGSTRSRAGLPGSVSACGWPHRCATSRASSDCGAVGRWPMLPRVRRPEPVSRSCLLLVASPAETASTPASQRRLEPDAPSAGVSSGVSWRSKMVEIGRSWSNSCSAKNLATTRKDRVSLAFPHRR